MTSEHVESTPAPIFIIFPVILLRAQFCLVTLYSHLDIVFTEFGVSIDYDIFREGLQILTDKKRESSVLYRCNVEVLKNLIRLICTKQSSQG